MTNHDLQPRNGTWDALQSIYLVIAGLAIAEAITLAFTNSDGTFGGTGVFHSSGGPLLVAFLVTIVRFAHGSVLHLTELNDERKWRLNMCGLLLQALIFFVAALAVRQTTDFLVSILAILITDSVWLISLRYFERDHPPPAFKQWISSNLLLGLFLGVCLAGRVWWLGPSWEYRIALAVMAAALVAAVVDYMQNDDVYALTNRTAYTPLPPSIAIPLITSKGRGGHHPPAPPTVYLAAPLFTLAERQHNTELTRELTRRFKGEVTFILPQEMTTDPQVDYESIAKTNLEALAGANVVLACLDGVDVDSGTSFEAGYARSKGKPILAYRTDLRLGEADGVNAMLRYACTKYIQFSALDTTLDRLADELAEQLSQPEMLDRPWKADVTPV